MKEGIIMEGKKEKNHERKERGKEEYLIFVNFINTCVFVKEHNNGLSKWSFVHSQYPLDCLIK